MSAHDHDWSPRKEAEDQRYRDKYENPTDIRPLERICSLEEFDKMRHSLYWSHLLPWQQDMCSKVFRTYEDYYSGMIGLLGIHRMKEIEDGSSK